MNVLVYKQTHLDDPGDTGVFGINDCMGEVRGHNFEHVIALYQNEVSWIGIDAQRLPWQGHSPQVIFKRFRSLLPDVNLPAGALAVLMEGKRHILLPIQTRKPQATGLSRTILSIFRLAANAPPSPGPGEKRRRTVCRLPEEDQRERGE